MKRRFFQISGLVIVIGGVLLADHGPDYGIPRLIGELCSCAGFPLVLLGWKAKRYEWEGFGIFLGLGVPGLLFYDLGQPNAILMAIGNVCFVAAILVAVLWFWLGGRRVKNKGKRVGEQPTTSDI